MHEELWTEVRDIVHKAVIKAIPKKKKCKKAKGFQMRPYKELRKEEKLKAKGEKERYTHLNAEFQRIASRDEKAFLSDQCKEIEGKKNKMGKTREERLVFLLKKHFF